ncbi:beta-N-acetylglucosaminidase domain-containing protein [Companilactobacillus bobalius]|uniref:Beta-N-acetylhexosaminidase n=2 Tax=Companilactobacillus bobalius TaxID=2801451 RepID=A0A202FD05_9LACO|nr:beta-N-acetylglucosaminidase domain-containing protein [Companilactobacillus bobalius]KAE9561735.1 hypothetical protein ATN92_06575 [Companilactobacillus bobalius]KRK82650.1 F5 8 type C domain protein [Companilactobacillus bobalius DSM 19674]OVE98356.1 Beta-N-acetylhexosaminidase [Companilactobacillus bobalius]GEO57602.1 hypothetical protein LBO01_07310 [Companilactobacillus paralimentarius]
MKYKLFPIPQDLVYDEGTISLSPKVNLMMDQNLDQYTKDRVLGILREFQIGSESNTQISAEMSNIIVRISKHPSHHYDGYRLMITESKIQLFGDNTDAVFYGLATLRQILKQSQGLKVQQLAIRDYADVKNRGFIEGYYGNPWSDADRINLMRFGSNFKLTQYIFAPKDDPYHNEKWRELYPQKRLDEIKKLARVGNETKTKFVWTIHPFMYNPIRFDRNYISDLRIIEKKFDQLMLVGVREFGILADDAPWPKHGDDDYIKLMKDISNFLKKRKKNYPDLITDMIFVPYYYYSDGAKDNGHYDLRDLNADLPKNIHMVVTGGKTFGVVSNEFLNILKDNLTAKGAEYRPVQLWINWPVNDGSRNNLIMSGAKHYLQAQADSKKIYGIMLNPMMQSESSKPAIFINAAYSWNIWTDNETERQVEHNAFNYVENQTFKSSMGSKALENLAQHMQFNEAMPELNLESPNLGTKLSQFIEEIDEKTTSQKEIDNLKHEFTRIKQDALYFKVNGQKNLRDEMLPWLDNAIDQMQSLEFICDYLSTGKKEFLNNAKETYQESQTHTFDYLQEIKRAEFGSQSIAPFLKEMLTVMK